MKVQRTEYDNFIADTNIQIKSLNKTVKNKDKEIHNLSKHLENSRDTVLNLKSEKSNLRCQQSKHENKIKRLEKQQKKKQDTASVFTQTIACVDTPYLITEALPPIFGSKLCVQTKPGFFTKSLPNLSSIVMVADTEDELALEAAENALSLQYEREVAQYYLRAKDTAQRLRQVYEDLELEKLFESKG